MLIELASLSALLTLVRSWAVRSRAFDMRDRRRAAGDAGERRVGELLDLGGGFDRLDGFVVGNAPRSMAEIDHVVRAGTRLLVIETKNWAGSVSGGELDRNWVLQRRDGTRTEMQNPIAQATRQARIVKELGGEDIEVLPLVVMAGRATHESGCFPPGVMAARRIPIDLPPLLAGPGGRDNSSEEVGRAWDRIVEHAYAPGAERRTARYLAWLERKFDKRPWEVWMILACLFAMGVWYMGMRNLAEESHAPPPFVTVEKPVDIHSKTQR